jgi:hypothetical protein
MMRSRKSRTFFFSVVTLLSLAFVSSLCQASDDLEAKIWSDKDQFLLYEPIIIHYELKNTSDSDLTLNFADLEEDFMIENQQGRKYHRLIGAWRSGWDTLAVGETHRGKSEVSDPYGIDKVGKYTCYMQTQHFGAPLGAWTTSDTITFKVVEPEGDEKEAASLFATTKDLMTRADREKRELVFSGFMGLVEKYPHSVYAPMSLYLAARACSDSSDTARMRESIFLYVRLTDDYPDFCCFDLVLAGLFTAFRTIKDKPGAIQTMNELIEKHPHTRISEEAEKTLEKVEKWEFE